MHTRKLWADEGCSALYTYCTQVLRFSEQEAYLRMEAARVAQQFPAVLEMLATGELSLTNVGLLKPHLTVENHIELLDAARCKSRREVARQVAALRDSGDYEARPLRSVRAVPTGSSSPSRSATSRTRSCSARRICSRTPCRTATSARSSTALSHR